MRRLVVAALVVLAAAGCSATPRWGAGSPSAPSATAPSTTAAAPESPLDSREICTRVRQTTRALGPTVAREFRTTGVTPQQLLDVMRAVYQQAESSLAGYRGQAEPALAGGIQAVEAQYAAIRAKLTTPADVDRVNYEPAGLKAAVANLDRLCGG